MANTSRTTNRTDEVRKAVSSATEQLRTPLLAALGAGNLASQAVADVVSKAKERVTETGETARKNIEELPTEVTTLRERLDPAELRKVIDDYTEAALKLYNKLAETGEQAWDRFLAEPRVKDVLKQVEEVLHTAQDRVGEVSAEAKDKVEGVLGTVSKKARAGGEKVAEASEAAAGKVEHAPAPAKPAPKTTTSRASSSTTRRTSSAAKKPSGGSTTSK
jgi:heparin binding hemagglutinin HbhA